MNLRDLGNIEMPKNFQTRSLGKSRVSIVDGQPLMTHGLAIPFDTESDDLGGFVEIIPSRVKINYWREDVYALRDHNWGVILGRNGSGTLQLDRRPEGVFATVSLPDNTQGNDLAVSIERGDINGHSFGFVPIDDSWITNDQKTIAFVEEMLLMEITITPIPAYTSTYVGLSHRVAQFEQHKRNLLAVAQRQARRRRLDMLGVGI